MQANSAEHQPTETSNSILSLPSALMDGRSFDENDISCSESEPTHFHGYYSSCMEMYADAQTVAAYLDAHHDWFRRCAHPMTADPLGENGYALIIGRFGSFGYEIEPKIGLDLLPQDQGVYRIKTIPVPDYEQIGYEVDFQASLELVEADFVLAEHPHLKAGADGQPPSKLTRVEWELNLDVAVQFPRFIQALPKSLVQTTGDRLLNQVVRQVSRCLTHKVQEDFHSTQNIPFTRKSRLKGLWSRGQNVLNHPQEQE